MTIYTNCATILLGCNLYTDTGLTTPAPDGKYSDGGTCFTVTGGAGLITTISACSAPPSCTEYYNNTGTTLNGINYTRCDGTPFTGVSVAPGGSFCAQDGSASGGDFGYLMILGACAS